MPSIATGLYMLIWSVRLLYPWCTELLLTVFIQVRKIWAFFHCELSAPSLSTAIKLMLYLAVVIILPDIQSSGVVTISHFTLRY